MKSKTFLVGLIAIAAASRPIPLALAASPPQSEVSAGLALVREPITPVKVVLRDDGVYFIDFGRDAFGQLELDIPAPPKNAVGAKIGVRLGEMLTAANHIEPKPGGSVTFLQTALTVEDGKTHYRVELPKADARRMPPEIGAVMPFRYVELQDMPAGTTAAALQAGEVRQIAVHYPFDDEAADFASSDEKLNAVWNLCKYSIKATSYAGIFVDGNRERKPYEADAYIDQLGWYCCTTDVTLPRITGDYLITHPTWPTEWILFSDFIAWQDYMHTGDQANLAAHYDELKAKTLRGLERADGLISLQPTVPAAVTEAIHFTGKLRDIVDWPPAERDGYKLQPVNTVVNAFHCRALSMMADIAGALGKKDDAADFRRAAEKSTASLNAKLFDPRTGLYIDGEGTDHSSLHANMFPLAFGLVPEERREKTTAFVQSRGMACSVYGAQFLLDALFDNDCGAQAVKLILAPGDRSWRHMIEDVGTTITLEAWDNKFKPNEDWNHAWGAAPANLLPRKVLGVEPLQPGFRKALIWPRGLENGDAGGLTWARGKVPTVKGPIQIEWHRAPAGFHLTVQLPVGITAEARLPADWGTAAHIDGKSVTAEPHNHYLALQISDSSKHEIVVGK